MTTSVRVRRRRVGASLLCLLLVAAAVFVTAAVLRPETRHLLPGEGTVGGEGEIAVGERISVRDTGHPALANLDPALLDAVQRAAAAAEAEGVEVVVTSGWRAPEYQARLLSEAIRDYGSEAEARRWVATPDTSLHVSGDAIDIGDFDATYWFSLHGAAYGLCQTYANERWHFELHPEAVTAGCPEPYLDPTHDPRTAG